MSTNQIKVEAKRRVFIHNRRYEEGETLVLEDFEVSREDPETGDLISKLITAKLCGTSPCGINLPCFSNPPTQRSDQKSIISQFLICCSAIEVISLCEHLFF